MNTKPVLGFTLRGEKDLNYLSSLHHNHQACHCTPTLFSLSWMNLPKWWNLPYFSSQEMLGLLLSLDPLGYALAVYTWLLLWGVQHISASLTQLRACACKWIYMYNTKELDNIQTSNTRKTIHVQQTGMSCHNQARQWNKPIREIISKNVRKAYIPIDS